VTRVLSGAVLIVIVVATVWAAPSWLFFIVAEAVLVLAFVEYARLAAAYGLPIPIVASGVATVLASIGITSLDWLGDRVVRTAVALDALLMSASVVLGALALVNSRGGRDALGRAAAAAFPLLYLGLPIGALAQIRFVRGPAVLFLLMLTVITSDTGQYYVGRAFGRRLLAPDISPHKTWEGAIGGFVFGALTMIVIGRFWLADADVWLRAALGLTVVALGIVGDLFESMLKRGAGVKDSSALIPGHGGILDRIDALLFAAPIYYVVLKWV
jgi:phosphatidate cytidylyltransferase